MTMTITQALSYTAEDLMNLEMQELVEIEDTLESSTSKRAMLKLDIVRSQIAQRENPKLAKALKEEKEAEQVTLEEVAEEAEEKEEPVKAKPKPKAKPKKKKNTPKKEEKPEETDSEEEEGTNELENRIKQLELELQELENAKVNEPIFPKVMDLDGVDLHRIDEIGKEEIQKFLIERPLELFCFFNDTSHDDLTMSRVLYLNDEAMILFDHTNVENTAINIDPRGVIYTTTEYPKLKSYFMLDNAPCKFKFYAQKLEEEEK